MATSNSLGGSITITSLPIEIFDVIPNLLDQPDRRSCSLVSKAFHTQFRPSLFRDIKLESDTLRRFAALLVKNPEIGGYVHYVQFQRAKKDWEKPFRRVARRLTQLRHLELWTSGGEKEWKDASGALQKGLRYILALPTLISVELIGHIVFSVSPRLLFFSPTIRKISVCPDGQSYCDTRHWAELDYAETSLAGTRKPSRCTSLQFTSKTFKASKNNWFPYVVANRAQYLSHLTKLVVEGVRLYTIQTIVLSLGAQLEELQLSVDVADDRYLDLSRNTGLRNLALRYSEQNAIPYDKFSIILNTLSGLTAPALHCLALTLSWLCPGADPTLQYDPHRAGLRELDACFARLSERHPCLKQVDLGILFYHHRCGLDRVCDAWPEFLGGDVERLRREYFPFLCCHRPENMLVNFTHDLKVLGRVWG